MLKSIEIVNFESHAHTIMEDFSPGFNLIRGPSNFGKTSIIRALRLVCFNEFNPESVRIGTKFCEVTLTTDRGVVKVRRGEKVNKWEVTPKGEQTKHFEKIGTELLPDVIEVTGMQPVSLGNVAFNANIMDQLEGHFLIDELDGKSASGSMRAQIVDEISGLSGIEGLIREVSLDNLRNGKDVKRLEEEAKELVSGMYDKDSLVSEEGKLDQASKLLAMSEGKRSQANDIDEAAVDIGKAQKSVQGARGALDALPDIEKALKRLKSADKSASDFSSMSSFLSAHVKTEATATGVRFELMSIPDSDGAKDLLIRSGEMIGDVSEAVEVLSSIGKTTSTIDGLKKELEGIPDVVAVSKVAKRLDGLVVDLGGMVEMMAALGKAQSSSSLARCELEIASEQYAAACTEVDAVLAEVSICPFCQKPIDGKVHKHVEPVAIQEPPVRRARVKKS